MNVIFDNSVAVERFKMNTSFLAIVEREEYSERINELLKLYTKKEVEKIIQGIIRFAFYIEPVKHPKIESTKFETRWSQTLNNDPRFCSYTDCILIFDKLLNELLEKVQSEEYKEFIGLIINNTLIAYEMNLGYINRVNNGGSIHNIDNVSFFWHDDIKKVYLLRKYLLDSKNHAIIDVFKEAYKKIVVKSYLTDRVLTGLHKTNREKRWECHPSSVHFALRNDCIAIEAKLIKQICHFENFPADLRETLRENNIVVFSNELTKCPITLEPLDFDKFKFELLNTIHGKSSFQVGHLHPLKSQVESDFSGHTADNISWISSIGNRIQGELSIEEIRDYILMIMENYKREGLID